MPVVQHGPTLSDLAEEEGGRCPVGNVSLDEDSLTVFLSRNLTPPTPHVLVLLLKARIYLKKLRTAETLINHSGGMMNLTVEPTGVVKLGRDMLETKVGRTRTVVQSERYIYIVGNWSTEVQRSKGGSTRGYSRIIGESEF